MGKEVQSNQYPSLSRREFLIVAGGAALAAAGCVSESTPTPSPIPSPTLEPSPTIKPTPEPTPSPTPNPVLESEYYVRPEDREDGVYYAGMIIRNTGSPDSVSIRVDDLYYVDMVMAIKDKLRQYDGVNVTWKVVSEALVFHPELAEILMQASAEGDEVGNHTWHHKNLEDMKQSQVRKEIRRQELIAQENGLNIVPLLGPPGGNGAFGERADREIRNEAIIQGYVIDMWSKESHGWADRKNKSEKARKRVLRDIGEIEAGDIIIMHDAWPDANALPELIERILEKGLRIEPITRAALIDPKLFDRPVLATPRPRPRVVPSPNGFEPTPSGLYVPESTGQAGGVIYRG